MSTATTKRKIYISPIGRVTFPDLVSPKKIGEEGEAKFRINLLVPDDDPSLAELKSLIKQAAIEKWGERTNDVKFLKSLDLPFYDAEEKDYDGYDEGFTLVKFSTKNRPQVVDQAKRPMDFDVTQDRYPGLYGGCWARVSYNPWAWEYGNLKKGVMLTLNNVQKVRDDEAFGGGPSKADDDFDTLPDDTDDDSPF